MEDGQEARKFAPDRDTDDPADFEFNGDVPPAESTEEEESSGDSSDSEDTDDGAETDAADDDADVPPAAQGGTPDPSFERFLAEWSDDDSISKTGDSNAAVHSKPPKVPAKRASATGSSSAAAPSKAAKTVPPAPKGKQVQATTARVPTGQAPIGRTKGGPAPKGTPLNVAPLRFRLPTGAPKTAGYALFFVSCPSSYYFLLTLAFLQGAGWPRRCRLRHPHPFYAQTAAGSSPRRQGGRACRQKGSPGRPENRCLRDLQERSGSGSRWW